MKFFFPRGGFYTGFPGVAFKYMACLVAGAACKIFFRTVCYKAENRFIAATAQRGVILFPAPKYWFLSPARPPVPPPSHGRGDYHHPRDKRQPPCLLASQKGENSRQEQTIAYFNTTELFRILFIVSMSGSSFLAFSGEKFPAGICKVLRKREASAW